MSSLEHVGITIRDTPAHENFNYTLKNKLWYIPVYMGYGVSFYIFPKSLVKYSLSTAYTIWCGLGLILTTSVDILIYKEILTLRKFLGLLAVIIGIKITK